MGAVYELAWGDLVGAKGFAGELQAEGIEGLLEPARGGHSRERKLWRRDRRWRALTLWLAIGVAAAGGFR